MVSFYMTCGNVYHLSFSNSLSVVFTFAFSASSWSARTLAVRFKLYHMGKSLKHQSNE